MAKTIRAKMVLNHVIDTSGGDNPANAIAQMVIGKSYYFDITLAG